MIASRIPRVLFVLASMAACGVALAEAPPVTPMDEMVVTQGEVITAGKQLRYTARTGLVPLYDNDTGELMARMFIIAYSADPQPGKSRPITFIWNGGPGSNSAQTHLIGFGPKGFKTPPTYPEWTGPATEIVDRPETWLTASDLVFVDPIGTGYSRATSIKYRDVLYTEHGDAEAVAEMIRIYRTRFNAFDAPLFIAGESYGAMRASLVADALTRRRTPLAGVILISGPYDVGQQVPPGLDTALQVQAFASAAYFHKRLAPELLALPREEVVRRATDWARNEYAPALERLDSLTPEQRTLILGTLVRYTGVDARFVDEKTLALTHQRHWDALLDDQKLELGHYDVRQKLQRRPDGKEWTPLQDPSLLPQLDLMQGTSVPLIRYLRETLRYRSDLLYRGPFGEAFHPQPVTSVGGYGDDWMAVMWEGGAYVRPPQASPNPGAALQPQAAEIPPLRRAMEAQPRMRLWLVQGEFDGFSSCAAKEEQVARSAPELRSRTRSSCYPAGHMVYSDTATRQSLQQDFTTFVRDAVAARTSR
jgi:carboxypeptidase C (cathepsin A)